MVRNVFPVWYSDLCEYETTKRPSSKVISQATVTISKTQAGATGSIYSDNPARSTDKPKRKSSPQNRSAPATTRTPSTLQVKSTSSDSLVLRSAHEHNPRSLTKAERSRSFQSLPRNDQLYHTGKTSLRLHWLDFILSYWTVNENWYHVCTMFHNNFTLYIFRYLPTEIIMVTKGNCF